MYKRQVEYTKAWVLNWDKVAQAPWFAIPKLVPVKIVFDMRAICLLYTSQVIVLKSPRLLRGVLRRLFGIRSNTQE